MTFKSKYTYDEKLRACNHYVVEFGSSRKVEKATGIPANTIRAWTQTDWWAEMVSEVRARHADKIDGRFTGLMTKMVDELSDRITNGDEVVNARTGEKHRKKMAGKDLATTLAIIVEKRALLRGDPTAIRKTTTIDKQLKSVQDKLAERGAEVKKQNKEEVVH